MVGFHSFLWKTSTVVDKYLMQPVGWMIFLWKLIKFHLMNFIIIARLCDSIWKCVIKWRMFVTYVRYGFMMIEVFVWEAHERVWVLEDFLSRQKEEEFYWHFAIVEEIQLEIWLSNFSLYLLYFRMYISRSREDRDKSHLSCLRFIILLLFIKQNFYPTKECRCLCRCERDKFFFVALFFLCIQNGWSVVNLNGNLYGK